MLQFDPEPSASEPCCPTHCSMEPVQLLTKVNEIKKKLERQRFELGPTAWETFVLTSLPWFSFQQRVGEIALIKKRPRWLNKFSYIFKTYGEN